MIELEEIVEENAVEETVLHEISTPSSKIDYSKLLKKVEKEYSTFDKKTKKVYQQITKHYEAKRKQYMLTNNQNMLKKIDEEYAKKWDTAIQELFPGENIQKYGVQLHNHKKTDHVFPRDWRITSVVDSLGLSQEITDHCRTYMESHLEILDRKQQVLDSYKEDMMPDGYTGVALSCAIGAGLAVTGLATGGIGFYIAGGVCAVGGSLLGPVVGFYPRKRWIQRKQRKAFKQEIADLRKTTIEHLKGL